MAEPGPRGPPVVTVRTERAGDPADAHAVRAVEAAAFPTEAEADLVDALRASGDHDPSRSLIAEVGGQVVGHCLLTLTSLERPDGRSVVGRVLAVGPMAVVPAWQRLGIGTRLMLAALERCERDGVAAVVLVGSPKYYGRFGFAPARAQGLLPPGHWHDEVWLARRLPASTAEDVGVVRYARPFMELD